MVVGRGEDAAAPRRDTPHAEEIAADENAVRQPDLTAGREIKVVVPDASTPEKAS
jgi:hypothetical protein